MLLHALAPRYEGRAELDFTLWLGLAFILLGVLCAAYASRQYSVVLRTLGPAEFPSGYGTRWGLVINGIVALLGVILALELYLEHT